MKTFFFILEIEFNTFIGLQLVRLELSAFLNIGVTFACFSKVGKIPVLA